MKTHSPLHLYDTDLQTLTRIRTVLWRGPQKAPGAPTYKGDLEAKRHHSPKTPLAPPGSPACGFCAFLAHARCNVTLGKASSISGPRRPLKRPGSCFSCLFSPACFSFKHFFNSSVQNSSQFCSPRERILEPITESAVLFSCPPTNRLWKRQ